MRPSSSDFRVVNDLYIDSHTRINIGSRPKSFNIEIDDLIEVSRNTQIEKRESDSFYRF